MKKVFSFITICIITCLTFVFAGCSKTADLYELGLQMTTQMEELVKNDFYAKLFIGDISEDKRSAFIANDYDSPVKVFSISIPDAETIVEKSVEIYDEEWTTFNEEWSAVPETVKQQILNQVSFQIVYSGINSKNGSYNTLIVSSYYISVKTFEGYSLKEDIAYLYLFETGMPVVVTFSSENDGIKAVAQFLLLPKTSTLSELRDVFTPFGCSVNVVNI